MTGVEFFIVTGVEGTDISDKNTNKIVLIFTIRIPVTSGEAG